jgi:hypothetical protein
MNQTVEVYHPDGSITTKLVKRPTFEFEERKTSSYAANGSLYNMHPGSKVEVHHMDQSIETYWDKPSFNYCVSSTKRLKGFYFRFYPDGAVMMKTPKLAHWWGPEIK